MASLTETLQDPARLEAVVKDGAVVIDEEVRAKRGLRGMALKAGYKTVKTVHPDVVERALRKLLPEFAPEVDPFYARARESGQEVRVWFGDHATEIAEALLGVTDRRADNAQNRVIKKAYMGLRAQARGHVEEALPRVAELIERHVR